MGLGDISHVPVLCRAHTMPSLAAHDIHYTFHVCKLKYLCIPMFPDSYRQVLLYGAAISMPDVMYVTWDQWFTVIERERCKKHF